MPVHLGSMDRAVETIIRENAGCIRPGDVYAINAPYNGHPPAGHYGVRRFSMTPSQGLFWVASRGHHADVGGIAGLMCRPTPGPSKKASISTISGCGSQPFPRDGARAPHRRQIPGAQCAQNVNDLAQIAAKKKACRSCAR
jgi:5-oxoprolinase (ATP-hydrolysing)